MNKFVSKYSSSPLSLPQEERFGQLCGKWDAAQQLAFPSFDVPAIHNVSIIIIRKTRHADIICIAC
jgi:20S proteasome subunit beta 5